MVEVIDCPAPIDGWLTQSFGGVPFNGNSWLRDCQLLDDAVRFRTILPLAATKAQLHRLELTQYVLAFDHLCAVCEIH